MKFFSKLTVLKSSLYVIFIVRWRFGTIVVRKCQGG